MLVLSFNLCLETKKTMQNRYAGDVGDFGKFLLLRHLFGKSKNRIGVIWYLFPDESHNDDGGRINYLTNRDFRDCDYDLCNKLSAIAHGNRSVVALEKAGLLPMNTVYFSDRLDFHLKYPSQCQKDRQDREMKRKEWLERAVLRVSECNVIFLDPDNGLQIRSCSKISQVKSGKFSYYSEISELAKDKDTTVIYHHLNRNATHVNQIRTKVDELRKHINPTGTIFAVRYWPYSTRAYFILTTGSKENRIRESLMSFVDGSSGKYWDSYFEERTH
jgi:hypothetical protein